MSGAQRTIEGFNIATAMAPHKSRSSFARMSDVWHTCQMSDARRRQEEISGEVVLRIARAYYIEDRSKVQIAADTGLSRWQVARVLADARARGIVQVHVGDPGTVDEALGRAVVERYGIRQAIVVGGSRGLHLAPTTDTVAQALADHLQTIVRPGSRIGLAWSRVIEAMPQHLGRLAPCDVVQLAGALTFAGDRLGSVEVIRQVARIAGGTAYPVYAPLVATSAETARALMDSPEIGDVFQRADHLDIAVVGVGTWTREGSSILPLLPSDLVARTERAGAAGVMSGRVFDDRGRRVDAGADGRIVGVTLAQLAAVPDVVATCTGAHRAPAVAAAVRGGLVDTLIVDESLARALLRP